MSEQTPGPWKEVWEGSQEEKRGGWAIVGANGHVVMSAYVTETDAGFTLPNAPDRALILAAAEQQAKIDALLEAARAAYVGWETGDDVWGPMQQLKAAIAQGEAL